MTMISFDCEHCGKPVRVSDAYAGKKGRCPRCKGIVSIPELTGNANINALAAAVIGSKDDSATNVPPPPLPTTRKAETDEFSLVDTEMNSSLETDTYPAIHNNQPVPTPRRMRSIEKTLRTVKASRRSIATWLLVVLMVIIAALSATVVVLLVRR